MASPPLALGTPFCLAIITDVSAATPQLLTEAMQARGLPLEQFRPAKIGETRVLR